jgi:hypothetical protein
MMSSIFYRLGDKASEVLHDALEVSAQANVFVLPQNEYQRKLLPDKDPKEALDEMLKSREPHLVFIYRTGFAPFDFDVDEYGECGGCTMSCKDDIYIFIYLKIDDFNALVSKYDLKPSRH